MGRAPSQPRGPDPYSSLCPPSLAGWSSHCGGASSPDPLLSEVLAIAQVARGLAAVLVLGCVLHPPVPALDALRLVPQFHGTSGSIRSIRWSTRHMSTMFPAPHSPTFALCFSASSCACWFRIRSTSASSSGRAIHIPVPRYLSEINSSSFALSFSCHESTSLPPDRSGWQHRPSHPGRHLPPGHRRHRTCRAYQNSGSSLPVRVRRRRSGLRPVRFGRDCGCHRSLLRRTTRLVRSLRYLRVDQECRAVHAHAVLARVVL